MNFDEAYKKLNSAQKEAVDFIEGPLLVMAGPGTGKTQLLSTRVANILKQTDTDARNILCLTFTNKAATNMRERLQKLTDGEARYVNVKTFHGFASEIMNSYSQYFWNGANLSNAPEAVSLSILESIFATLPLDNHYASKFNNAYTMLAKAQKQIARTKDAGLTPEKLRVMLQANLEYIDTIESQMVEILSPSLSFKKLGDLQQAIETLPSQPIEKFTAPLIGLETKIKESLEFAITLDEPTGKTKNTSNWKKNWLTTEDDIKGMHRERRRNHQWLHLADIYEKYREALHKRGFYDYSDMLLEVIVQIEKHSDLKAEVQERFNYVLIDEFQDSNAAQLRLAHLIADHPSMNGKPNIMAVGDDDQSIYGFNGAELNNMLHFERTYGKDAVKTIVLEENYRSTPEVLKTAQAIIENNEDRLVNRIPGLTKNLKAKADDLPQGEITHISYLTKEHQLHKVARNIKAYWQENSQHSIAVLARNHKSLEPLAAILNALDVPFTYEKQQNILQNEAVEQIILVCTAVQAIMDGNEELLNATLSLLLRHPMFVIESKTLWEIAKSNRYDPQWFSSILDNPETKHIGNWLDWLASEASYQPLPVILEHIIGLRDDSKESYVKHYFIEDQQLSQEYIQTLSAVRILKDLASEFTVNSQPTLNDFLAFIETEKNNGKIISDSSPLIHDGSMIELLSVHKAKGLEFNCVYIIDAVEEDWQPSGNKEGVPTNLPLQPPLESEDEYTRLMYVAATRAKHAITFTSYRKNEAGEDVLSTPLIRSVPITIVEKPTENETITIAEDTLSWPRLKRVDERSVLKNILENFTINPTNLIAFLDVTEGGPENFLQKSLLRLPTVKSNYMSHGIAMHAALELAQKLVNLGSFNLEEVKAEYRRALTKEHLPKKRLPLQIDYGEKNLERLFNDYGYTLINGSQPELSLGDITVGEARIGGKLDRIDFINEQSLRIVDYKTGSGLPNLFTKDKTKEVKAWKHKLQLTFYALLAKNHPSFSAYKNIEGQMVYIETKYQKGLTLSYTPSAEEIDRLERLVKAVWQKIQNYDLPETSQYQPTLAGIQAFEQDLLK